MQPFLQLWRRLSPNQRLGFTAALLAVAATGLVATLWARQPEYSVLFSGMEPRDAGQVADELRSKKVPYRISGGGGTIEVPANQVLEMRLELASAGLPRAGGTGWELMDKSSLGMTDFAQNLNYQRALEGELARTVSQLAEVENARVHVVLPRQALFAEDKKNPTASVVLRLKAGARLGATQVQGITHLIAGSVEGLSPTDITILDTDGHILSLPREENSLAGLSSEQLEMQRGVEAYLAGKAQSMLAGVVGAGKVIVQVAATLDFNKVERTVETWDSENPVVRSEQRSVTPSASGNAESSVTNYEIGKTVAHVVDGVGAVKKLTAAVLVDGVTTVDAKGVGTYQPRSDDEMKKLTAVVRNAIGYSEERGDQVEVVNVPFETGPDPLEMHTMKKDEQKRFYMDLGGKVATGLLLLTLLFFARSFFRRATALSGGGAPLALSGGAEMPRFGEVAPQEMERRVLLLAQENPENVARALKSWLKEESGGA
jgi:flagellar M-ring protein FliF